MELQLFRLFHNEREMRELNVELTSKNGMLEKETRKQQKIDEELRVKKKEHMQHVREITKLEQQIKESVSDLAFFNLFSTLYELRFKWAAVDTSISKSANHHFHFVLRVFSVLALSYLY